MSIKQLIVLVGPTGCGKTDLSIRLAQHYGIPILSTDSRQFYRGMAIGTAQPTTGQLQAAEHHFIASHDYREPLSCGSYEVQALERLQQLFATHDRVLAVGGSGFYIHALCNGMDDLPPTDENLRKQLNERLAGEGIESLAEELRQLDPAHYAEVDRQNPARVIRALEVCLQTGKPYSSYRTGERKERKFQIVKIGVTLPREVLYERIDRRVLAMINEGLEAEARTLYPYRELSSLQTVGYRELFEWFDGRISREEAIALIQRNTRRYAKRQMTWFRRDSEIRWFSPTDDSAICTYIDNSTTK